MSHNTSQRMQDLAVTITLDEHERRSRAVARLRWRDRTLIGSGRSRIGVDNGVPAESGEQLALARALSDLTRQLLVLSVEDLEAVPAHATPA